MGSDKSSSSDDSDAGGDKKGGLCCCCCDYRRAVIIFSVCWIIVLILGIVNYYRVAEYFNIDDDVLDEEVKDAFGDSTPAILAMLIISLVVTCVCLAGAILYNKYMVGVSVIWEFIAYIVNMVYYFKVLDNIKDILADTQFDDDSFDYDPESVADFLSWTYFAWTTIWLILWVFPRVKLIFEIHKGVMTKKTYPREKASCCCV
mmetsp:Transcript_13380/g.15764  ORF Transcript_13380/g.15764 Transcript_13380/m.15764 type:complete len:203 (-) Transcript_13380:211-819(-)